MTGNQDRMQFSIGKKIFIICIILAIIPAVILGYISYSASVTALDTEVETLMITIVESAIIEKGRIYDLTQLILDAEVKRLASEFYNKGSPAIIDDKLVLVGRDGVFIINDNFEIVDTIVKETGNAATIFQIIGDKAIRISTSITDFNENRVVGTAASPEVYETIIKGNNYYGIANVLGTAYLTVYIPVTDASGTVIGSLFTGVPEKEILRTYDERVENIVIGKTGFIQIVDADGTITTHKSLVGENIKGEPYFDEIIQNKNGFIRTPASDGTDVLIAYGYYEPKNNFIIGIAPAGDFRESSDTIFSTILTVIIVIILLGGIIAFFFGRTISRPVTELKEVAQAIANGDLSQRVVVNGSDEIAILAMAYNDMASELQNKLELEKSIATLKNTYMKLGILFSITHHDITNQIMDVSLTNELLLDCVTDEFQKEQIQKSSHALELVLKHLTFIKKFQETAGVEMKWHHLHDLIENIDVPKLSNSITIHQDFDWNLEIYADPLFEKVLYTLFENAIRHGKRVTDITILFSPNGETGVLHIVDNGIGVLELNKLNIFKDGFGNNTGLGLYLSKEILDASGINIYECGTYGEGAHFVLEFPADQWRIG